MPSTARDITKDQFTERLAAVISRNGRFADTPFEDLLGAIPRVDELDGIAEGGVVLVRADVDLPISDGRVVDPARVDASAETIEHCRSRGWKTVVLGHVGRDPENTVAPVCAAFRERLGVETVLVADWLDEGRRRLTDACVETVRGAPAGSVIVLENTRKYALERTLWKLSPEELPGVVDLLYEVSSDIRRRLGAVEVNEAIAASNPDFSSTVIPLVMERTALGFHIEREMKVVGAARSVRCVVFSGLKIDKLDALEEIVERGQVRLIVAAGSLAMALKKAEAELRGATFEAGRADGDESYAGYIPRSRVEQAVRIATRCREGGIGMLLPVDFVLDDGSVAERIPDDRAQMDVGPATTKLYADEMRRLIEASRGSAEPVGVFFNGVFGRFEEERFARGTAAFVGLLGEMTRAGLRTYVGGGEGRMALEKYGRLDDVTHAFTCGGTVLKALGRGRIAPVRALYLQNRREREAV